MKSTYVIRQDDTGAGHTPDLTANLACRVVFSSLAILACCVPLRLLWKNNELAATVFIATVMVLNLFNIVNALIWQTDDTSTWWNGVGWCDLQTYVAVALQTIYAACICAIMRNVAQQVSLMRAVGPTASEKRRRNLCQALIIFPVPILQIGLTYLVLTSRYAISTLLGCASGMDGSWPTLVFFVMPVPIFTVTAVVYATMTYWRFRKVDRATRVIMNSGNSSIASRGARVRRKLYIMSITILVPFAPIQMAYLYWNIRNGMPWTKTYSLYDLHHPPFPLAWSDIAFITTEQISFIQLNQSYIDVLTVIPIFWFFGMSGEALSTYRKYLVAMGFARFFPRLRVDWDNSTSKTSKSASSTQPSVVSHSNSSTSDPSSGSRKAFISPAIRRLSGTQGYLRHAGAGASELAPDELPLWEMTTSASRTDVATPDSDHQHINGAAGDSSVERQRIPPFSLPGKLASTLSRIFRGRRITKEPLSSEDGVVTCSQNNVPVTDSNKEPNTESIPLEGPWNGVPKASVNTKVWSADEICPAPPTEVSHDLELGVHIETHITSSTEHIEQ